MRKKIITIVSVMLVLAGHSQVYIQTTLPTVGIVQKNQLWNLVLVNGATSSIEGKIDLLLRDRQSGVEMLTATTGKIIVPKGSLSVNVNMLNPVQYNYLGIDAAGMLNGLLPVGSYIACYSFVAIAGSKQEHLGEECIHFDIESLSPPMLIYPSDSAVLDAMPTQFSWTPPTPAGMFSQLRYEIFITEVKPGQRNEEALQDNASFYNAADLANNFLTYPSSSPLFEKEKWYSWQVVARDNKSYAGKSEVWVFKIKGENPAELLIRGTPFMKIKPGGSDFGIAPDGVLKLSYDNRLADSVATVSVRDLSSADGKNLTQFQVKVVPGENQIQYNLKKIMSLSEKNTYEASIVNSAGEKSLVLFSVKYFKD